MGRRLLSVESNRCGTAADGVSTVDQTPVRWTLNILSSSGSTGSQLVRIRCLELEWLSSPESSGRSDGRGLASDGCRGRKWAGITGIVVLQDRTVVRGGSLDADDLGLAILSRVLAHLIWVRTFTYASVTVSSRSVSRSA